MKRLILVVMMLGCSDLWARAGGGQSFSGRSFSSGSSFSRSSSSFSRPSSFGGSLAAPSGGSRFPGGGSTASKPSSFGGNRASGGSVTFSKRPTEIPHNTVVQHNYYGGGGYHYGFWDHVMFWNMMRPRPVVVVNAGGQQEPYLQDVQPAYSIWSVIGSAFIWGLAIVVVVIILMALF